MEKLNNVKMTTRGSDVHGVEGTALTAMLIQELDDLQVIIPSCVTHRLSRQPAMCKLLLHILNSLKVTMRDRKDDRN